jgi:ketosteroid isomerase-like protein
MPASIGFEDILRRRSDGINRHDIRALSEVYFSDVVLFDPIYPQPVTGRENILNILKASFEAFPDYHDEILGLYVSKNKKANAAAAVELLDTGTFSGVLRSSSGRSFQPTGNHFEQRYMVITHFDNSGLISQLRAYYDPANLLRQLGIKFQER